MKHITTVLITILLALQLKAAECAAVQLDNQGLVTNIVPCYRDPILSEWEGRSEERRVGKECRL